jgi:hypothetical protein
MPPLALADVNFMTAHAERVQRRENYVRERKRERKRERRIELEKGKSNEITNARSVVCRFLARSGGLKNRTRERVKSFQTPFGAFRLFWCFLPRSTDTRACDSNASNVL